MDRRDSILKYTTKQQSGIEIGPWFNPIAPKREGYRCLTLDVFDSETLRKRAASDPNVPATAVAMIEDVDLVGSSTSIGELVRARGEAGTFDYIVSSHNFEHIPDPIRFLQGCAETLRPGGVLSMAIPDRRGCFDYFRPVTRLSEWIQAFQEGRERPSPAQVYDSHDVFAHVLDGNAISFAFHRNMPTDKVSPELRFSSAYDRWHSVFLEPNDEYVDSHCSVFTPSSFELLMRDCAYLGLVPFEVIEVFDAGSEFHAHLKVNHSPEVLRPADHERTRNMLLHRIQDEAAETSTRYQEMRLMLEQLTPRIEAAGVQVDQQALQVNGQIERIRQLDERTRQLEETIRALRSSTSWRITEPLRRLASGKVGRNLVRGSDGIRRVLRGRGNETS